MSGLLTQEKVEVYAEAELLSVFDHIHTLPIQTTLNFHKLHPEKFHVDGYSFWGLKLKVINSKDEKLSEISLTGSLESW